MSHDPNPKKKDIIRIPIGARLKMRGGIFTVTSASTQALILTGPVKKLRVGEKIQIFGHIAQITRREVKNARIQLLTLGEFDTRPILQLERSKRRWVVQFKATKGEQVGTIKMGAFGDTWEDAVKFVQEHTAGQYDSIGEITEIPDPKPAEQEQNEPYAAPEPATTEDHDPKWEDETPSTTTATLPMSTTEPTPPETEAPAEAAPAAPPAINAPLSNDEEDDTRP